MKERKVDQLHCRIAWTMIHCRSKVLLKQCLSVLYKSKSVKLRLVRTYLLSMTLAEIEISLPFSAITWLLCSLKGAVPAPLC